MTPRELVDAVGLTKFMVRVRVKGLAKRGLVELTGKTMSRQISLSSRARSAKEGP